MFRLGIVGHRYLANSETAAFVAAQSLTLLREAQSQYRDVVALSAIAEGADTLFAEAALSLNIPLEIVRPFTQYVSDFKTANVRERYVKLQAAAQTETILDHENRSDAAYSDAMNWIVNKSDVLVVAWDGLPASGSGGTGAAVKRVVELNRAWWYLDTKGLSVSFHPGSGRPER